MELKNSDIKIIPPSGYCIDLENSTPECITFKRKVSYEDIAKELFLNKLSYYIRTDGSIGYLSMADIASTDPNNATSKEQLQKLLAINKLMNVRKFLCPDYVAKENEPAYSIYIDNNSIEVEKLPYANYIDVFFPDEDTVYKAIDILGEETIRLALNNNI